MRFVAALLFILMSSEVRAVCTSPAGVERQIIWNTAQGTYQFCDGTDWWSMKSQSANAATTIPSGSTGHIQFNSYGITGASPNLFWDDTNSRLGIGTSAPVATIQAAGDVQVSTTAIGCSSTTKGAIRYNSGALQFCNGTAWTTAGNTQQLRAVRVYTSNTTWTKPAGVTYIKVVVIGGGGGGGRQVGSYGGGGGAGGTCIRWLDVTSIASVAVTRGAAGTGATVDNTSGGAGGTSTFGAYCTANGGAGGIVPIDGGAGGTASGGDINITGQDGDNNRPGSNYWGGTNGGNGAGGWGQQSTTNGNNGVMGMILVWEYGS